MHKKYRGRTTCSGLDNNPIFLSKVTKNVKMKFCLSLRGNLLVSAIVVMSAFCISYLSNGTAMPTPMYPLNLLPYMPRYVHVYIHIRIYKGIGDDDCSTKADDQ